ncbi:hypothetical protein BC829DRAFT_390062, partial [Chytridium lagenaria]
MPLDDTHARENAVKKGVMSKAHSTTKNDKESTATGVANAFESFNYFHPAILSVAAKRPTSVSNGSHDSLEPSPDRAISPNSLTSSVVLPPPRLASASRGQTVREEIEKARLSSTGSLMVSPEAVLSFPSPLQYESIPLPMPRVRTTRTPSSVPSIPLSHSPRSSMTEDHTTQLPPTLPQQSTLDSFLVLPPLRIETATSPTSDTEDVIYIPSPSSYINNDSSSIAHENYVSRAPSPYEDRSSNLSSPYDDQPPLLKTRRRTVVLMSPAVFGEVTDSPTASASSSPSFPSINPVSSPNNPRPNINVFYPPRRDSTWKNMDGLLDAGAEAFAPPNSNYAEAFDNWQKASQLASDIGDAFTYARAVSNMGCVMRRLSLFEESLDLHRHAWTTLIKFIEDKQSSDEASIWLQIVLRTFNLLRFHLRACKLLIANCSRGQWKGVTQL